MNEKKRNHMFINLTFEIHPVREWLELKSIAI